MSSTIDQRIVEMQFENANFERNIKQSMKSLNELDESLAFKNSHKGFDEIQKASDSISFDKMADGIDSISHRFTFLGRLVQKYYDKISDYIVDTSKNLAKSLTIGQISAGWGKYEEKTKSVQTIMNATGKTVSEVDGYLNQLMWYSDETSYNFSEMTSAIGTLTASGGDIDKMISMVMGMANATAFAGKGASEFSRVIYNLNQSYSQGYLSYIDWKSVQLAGVASEQLKQTLIDSAVEAGTLKKNTDGTYRTLKGTKVTVSNMASTLSEKWATSEVMEKAFGKFAEPMEEAYRLVQEGKFDTASEALEYLNGKYEDTYYKASTAAQQARSFGEAIAATKDAVSSGWMKSFELIFGNKDEATELWTDLANALWKVFASGAEARNELLQLWKDAGGRDDLIKGITDALIGLWGIVVAVKDALADLFPPITVDTLLNMSKAVKKFGANLRLALFYKEDFLVGLEEVDPAEQVKDAISIPDFSGELELGAKSDEVKQLQENLKKLGFEVGSADGIFGPKTLNAMKQFEEQYGLTIDGVYDKTDHEKIYEIIDSLGKSATQVGEFTGELKKGAKGDEVKKLQEQLIELGYLDPAGADGIFGPKTEEAMKKFQEEMGLTADGIYNADVHEKLKEAFSSDGIADTLKGIYGTIFGKNLKNVQSIVKGIGTTIKIVGKAVSFLWDILVGGFKSVGPIIEVVLSLLGSVGQWITNLYENGKIDEWITNIKNTLAKWLDPVTEKIRKAADAIKRFFGFETDAEGASDKLVTFQDLWEKVKNGVSNLKIWGTIKNTFAKIRESLSNTSPALKEWWATAKEALGERFTEFLNKAAEKIPEIFDKIGNAFNNFLTFIQPFIDKIPGIVENIVLFFATLFGGEAKAETSDTPIEKVEEQAEKIDKISGIVDKIKAGWEKFKTFFSGVYNFANGFLNKFGGVGGVSGFLIAALGVIGAGKSFKLLKKGGKLIKQGFDIVETVTTTLTEGFGDLIRGVTGFIGRLPSLITSLNGLLDNIGKAAKKLATAEMLKGLAILIGTIVVSILIFCMIPEDKLWKGVAALGVLMIILIILFAVIENMSKSKLRVKGLASMAGVFSGLALALGVMMAVILIMGNMDWDTMKQGFIALIALLAIIRIFMATLNSTNSSTSIKLKGFIGLSIAIGILALIAKMIAKMQVSEMIKGFSGLLVLCLLLKMLMRTMNVGLAYGNGKMKMSGFIGLSIAIGILALIARMLSKMKVNEMIKGFAALFVVMKLMQKTVEVIANSMKGNVKLGGLISIAITLAIFVATIAILGTMETGTLIKGLLGLIGVMFALKLVLSAIKTSLDIKTGVALLIASLGFIAILLTFSYILNNFKEVNVDTVLAFSGSIALIMLGFSAAVKAMSKVKPLAILSMLLALIGLCGVMYTLSYAISSIKDVDPKVISVFSTGLMGALLGFAVFMAVASTLGVGGVLIGALALIVIAAAIALIAAGIGALSKWQGAADLIKSGMTFLGEVCGAFEGAKQAAQIKQMAAGLESLSGSDVDQSKVDGALAAAQAVANFANSFPEMTITEAIATRIAGDTPFGLFCKNLVTFGEGIKSLQTGIADLTPELTTKATNAVAAVTPIANFANSFPNITITEAIANKIAGGSPFALFCTNLTAFGESMKSVSTSLANFTEDNSTEIGYATSAATGIATLANSFPEITITAAIANSIAGNTPFGTFCENIPTFASSMETAARALANGKFTEVDTANIGQACVAALGIATLANSFPELTITEAIAQKITGDSPFGTFCKNIPTFADSLASAAVALSDGAFTDVDAGNITLATTTAQGIADLSNSLEGMTLDQKVLSLITGESQSDFADFCKDIGTFKTSLVDFKNGIAGISGEESTVEADATTALSIAKQIASFISSLNSDEYSIEDPKGVIDEWFSGSTKTDSVIEKISQLGEAIGGADGLAAKIAEISESTAEADVTSLTNILTSIAGALGSINLDTSLDDSGVYDGNQMVYKIDQFIQRISTLGGSISSFNADIVDIDETKVTSIMNAVTALGNAMSLMGKEGATDSFDKAINSLKSLFLGEWSQNSNSEANVGAITSVCNTLLSVATGYTSQFVTAGYNFSKGLGQGIENAGWFAKYKAYLVAKGIIKSVMDVLKEKSPSRVARGIGEYFSVGLGMGVEDKGSEAINASKNVAESMLSTTKGGLSTLNALISDTMDGDPVIRPVMDLSDVQSGAKAINGMFTGAQTISTKTAYSNASATAASMTKAKMNQNGSEASNGGSSFSSNDSSVNLSGNNFYVRSEQDIHSLASEIASLTRQQQRGLGAGF